MEPYAEMVLWTIERAGYPVTVASTTDDATGTTTYTATAVDDAGGRRLVTAPSGMQALFELADQIGFENLNGTRKVKRCGPANRVCDGENGGQRSRFGRLGAVPLSSRRWFYRFPPRSPAWSL